MHSWIYMKERYQEKRDLLQQQDIVMSVRWNVMEKDLPVWYWHADGTITEPINGKT